MFRRSKYMKQFAAVVVVGLLLAGCSQYDGKIPISELERINDVCENNDGIKQVWYTEEFGYPSLITAVDCNDGAHFRQKVGKYRERW